MKFKKLSDYEENYLGYEEIEVVQFNFDGEGSALAICDGALHTLCNFAVVR